MAEEATGLPAELARLRAEIDRVDAAILGLLGERGRLTAEVGKIKHAAGTTQYYHPDREAEILRRVMAENPGPFSDQQVARVFREIISAGLALEEPLRVAYLGPEGTFSQMAAEKHFGRSAQFHPVSSIAEIFREVDSGQIPFGVVPVENSTEGSVNLSLDLMLDHPLQICGEVQLRIVHNLVGRGPRSSIRRVHVHYQTRAQCRLWLAEQLPHAELCDAPSNAEAARRAALDPESAAISTRRAAELAGVEILVPSIEDQPDNTTRFWVIGRSATRPTGSDKTSLVVAGAHRAGSLHHLLSPFAEAGLNLTRIESRPARANIWEYVFYLDFLGHRLEPQVAAVLERIEAQASFYRCLGSYPRAVF
ncbi:MAG: prephenate dehydratase [Acidithiobacillus sp.]|uniref:prephenate dehydratase n=1 Tax=Acidithiobacillus sp. TaxID=1872118 RepID=UPI00258B8DB3|nr:prephenate dehydratase [Acidithiobacillus sp.]MCE5420088.1 prephenate dehydratase [Acidithiobacillus sp.]